MRQCWCGNDRLEEYSEGYVRCDVCHTLVSKNEFEDAIYQVQDEESDLYGKNYWEETMTKAAGKNTISEVVDLYLTERVLYWLKYVLKYMKLGGNIAEVGCGLGQLQYVLKRLGYEQIAFELSRYVCNYLEKELKVCAHCGSFAEEQENKYDGLLAFDLFEHLKEPLEFMEWCSDRLKEDGVLCFQTPCYDPELDYNGMREKKGRFEALLREEQHIFLYSRDAMVKILKRYGFEHIKFEPAFFGDDYDMFFFASKREFSVNTDDEIDAFLNSRESGRLVKAMLTLFDEKREALAGFEKADRDRKDRLLQVQELTGQLKSTENDSEKRLRQVETLTKQLQESEADRTARAEQIDCLTKQVREAEDRQASQLKQIGELSGQLQESEADRAARLEQINALTQNHGKKK